MIEKFENNVALAYNPRAMFLRTMLAAVFALAAAGFVTEARAQQPDEFAGQARPLITEDVELIRPGTIRAQAGIAFLQDQNFSLSGLNGDLTRIGEFGVHIGISPNVELQIDGTAQDFLAINDQFRPALIPTNINAMADDTHDIGDVTISAKIKLMNEGKHRPAFGVRIGFQLPNTNQAEGIGTNSINLFSTILASKTIGRFHLMGNLGLGILQSPTELFSQNDVILYGAAFRFRVTPRFRIVGEVNGRYSTRVPPPGTEDLSEGRIGVQVDAAGLHWDAAGTFGFTQWSPNTGVIFGVTYDIKDSFDPVLK